MEKERRGRGWDQWGYKVPEMPAGVYASLDCSPPKGEALGLWHLIFQVLNSPESREVTSRLLAWPGRAEDNCQQMSPPVGHLPNVQGPWEGRLGRSQQWSPGYPQPFPHGVFSLCWYRVVSRENIIIIFKVLEALYNCAGTAGHQFGMSSASKRYSSWLPKMLWK